MATTPGWPTPAPRRSPASSTASASGSSAARPSRSRSIAGRRARPATFRSRSRPSRNIRKRSSSPAARHGAPPPPPPPPPSPERGGDVMAQEERLGDVRLYRVPISVTVAARSQKQIALLRQPAVKFDSVLRLRVPQWPMDAPLERVLVTRNRTRRGPWPAAAGRQARPVRDARRPPRTARRRPHRRPYDRREGRDPRRHRERRARQPGRRAARQRRPRRWRLPARL